jgi:hypothetical protein
MVNLRQQILPQGLFDPPQVGGLTSKFGAIRLYQAGKIRSVVTKVGINLTVGVQTEKLTDTPIVSTSLSLSVGCGPH